MNREELYDRYPRTCAAVGLPIVCFVYVLIAFREMAGSLEGLGRTWWADMKTAVRQIRTGKRDGYLHLGESYPDGSAD